MPRVFTSANDPVDFCKKHFPTEGAAEVKYGHVGDGPDGRGNCFSHDAEHPPYEGDSYKCAVCKLELKEEDN